MRPAHGGRAADRGGGGRHLVNIASLDRNEDGIQSLPRILAESVGKDIETVYREKDAGNLEAANLFNQITEGVRAAVRASVERSTDDAAASSR